MWNLFDKPNNYKSDNCLGEDCQKNGPAHELIHSSRIHSYDHVNNNDGDVVSICQGGYVYLWRNGTLFKKCLLPASSIMSFATGCPLYFCKYRAGLVVYNDDHYVYSARLEDDPGMTEDELKEGDEEKGVQKKEESLVENKVEENSDTTNEPNSNMMIVDPLEPMTEPTAEPTAEVLEEKKQQQEEKEKAVPMVTAASEKTIEDVLESTALVEAE